MFQRGAIVVRRPESAWAKFLSGLGLGITQSYERSMAEQERRKNLVSDLLLKTGMGEIPSGFWGSETGQDFLEHMGLTKEPEVRGLIEQGRREFEYPEQTIQTPGGSAINIPATAPEAVPQDVFLQAEREKAYNAEMQKYAERELIKRRTEQMFRKPELTLSQKLKTAKDTMNAFNPQDLQNVSVTHQGITVNFYTALEKTLKQQELNLKQTKAGNDFLKSAHDYTRESGNIIKSLQSIAGGESLTKALQEYYIYPTLPENIKNQLKKVDPQKQIGILRPYFQRQLDYKWKLVRNNALSARVPQEMIPVRTMLDDAEIYGNKPSRRTSFDNYMGKFWTLVGKKKTEHKTLPPGNPEDLRSGIKPPPKTSEEERKIEELAQQFIQEAKNMGVVLPAEKARELAEEELKKNK